MPATKDPTPKAADVKFSGFIDIIYSAKDRKRPTSPPPKSLQQGKTSFPSPPFLHPKPKRSDISKPTPVTASIFEPKPDSLPRRQESKCTCAREAIHCCSRCPEMFATEGEVLLHQATRHRNRVVDFPIATPGSPVTRNLDRIDKMSKPQVKVGEFAPRGQGQLWVPPISTWPKQ